MRDTDLMADMLLVGLALDETREITAENAGNHKKLWSTAGWVRSLYLYSYFTACSYFPREEERSGYRRPNANRVGLDRKTPHFKLPNFGLSRFVARVTAPRGLTTREHQLAG